jgi:hypothetical protein
LGWEQTDRGWHLRTATFRPNTPESSVNVLVTGQIGAGKDWVFRGIVQALMHQGLTPEDLQVVILDGKGLDYPGYDGLGFVIQAAHTMEDIPHVLGWLDQETRRRRDHLAEAGAKSFWSYYDQGRRDMPFVLVYVSELTKLERHVEKFWAWLEDHLTSDRAYGLGFVVGTQTASNMPTRWRRQCQVFVAGVQPSAHDDKPNTNRTTDEWEQAGLVPPSLLPAEPGHFALVQGRAMATIRGVVIPDAEEHALLQAIRDRWCPAHPDNPVEPGADSSCAPAASAGLSGRARYPTGYPTLGEIYAWVQACQRDGLPVSQTRACEHFWGGKNADRNSYIRSAFQQLGVADREPVAAHDLPDAETQNQTEDV